MSHLTHRQLRQASGPVTQTSVQSGWTAARARGGRHFIFCRPRPESACMQQRASCSFASHGARTRTPACMHATTYATSGTWWAADTTGRPCPRPRHGTQPCRRGPARALMAIPVPGSKGVGPKPETHARTGTAQPRAARIRCAAPDAFGPLVMRWSLVHDYLRLRLRAD